jgi:hypothetical protein
LQNSSEYIFTIVQADKSTPAREIILNHNERAPLFSNDKDKKSPDITFGVKDHDFSDVIDLTQPMLIFIALRKLKTDTLGQQDKVRGSKSKIYTIKEKNSGFRIEQFTNFNI